MAIRSGSFELTPWVYLLRSGLGSFVSAAVWLLLCAGVAYVDFDVWLCIAMLYTGFSIGGWIGELRRWPGFVLIPGFSQRLFVLCLAIIVIVVLILSVASWYSGSSSPVAGPALLLGLLAACVGAEWSKWRGPVWFLAPLLFMVPFVFATFAIDFTQFEARPWLRVVSRLDAQLAAIAMAIWVAAALKRLIAAPADEKRMPVRGDMAETAVQRVLGMTTSLPIHGVKFITTWRVMAKLSLLIASVAFAMDLLFQLMIRLSGGHQYGVIWSTFAIILWPTAMMNDGVDFRCAWLAGVGRTRRGLALRVVARVILAGALPMLAFLLALEAVRSSVTGVRPLFELLLIAQVLAFGLIVCCFAFRERFRNRIEDTVLGGASVSVLVLWVWCYFVFLSDEAELAIEVQFGLEAYANATLVLLASALLALFAVSRGLARADHLH